jgi:hypothetical protein
VLLLQHRADVAAHRQAGDIAADRVRRFREDADLHTQRVRGSDDLRRLRMLLGEVADQDGRVLAALQCFFKTFYFLRQFGWSDDLLALQRHQPVVVRRMQHVDVRAALRRLAKAVRDQGMLLAQERADHQHAVEVLQLRNRHAEPGNALPRAVGREVGLPQAEIRCGAELAGEIELFQSRMGRGEHPNVFST